MVKLVLCAALAALASANQPSLVASSRVTSRAVTMSRFRGGDVSEAVLQATYSCNSAASEAAASAMDSISSLKSVVEKGDMVSNMGSKAGEVLNKAMQSYESDAPSDVEAVFDSKKEELEKNILTELHTVYLMQLQALKGKALQMYTKTLNADDDAAGKGMVTADNFFAKEAAASVPADVDWSFEAEQAALQDTMQALAAQAKRTVNAKLQASQQMSTAMQYLHMQQAQMQALQQQAYGGEKGKWNLGAAYRPPDSNINLSLAYQQGRTNVQVSMVPDEQASLLGPNGFTAGVGPANLGLSFNVNI